MSSDPTGFTKRLNQVIEEFGGPPAVARKLGCSPQAVYAWQEGSRPQDSRIIDICSKLGVSRRWLLHGEGSEEASQVSSSLHTPTMIEDTVGTKENTALAQTLAELITGFDDLPPAYEAMALRQIEEHFAEFRRRASLRASVRHPSKPHYDSPKNGKRAKR